MVNYFPSALDATFGALADATRRAILARLAGGECSVSQVAGQFQISLPGVAKHLRVLEKAGLVITSKTGRVRRCRLVPAPMKDAAEWIAFYRRFWEDQFDALDQFIEQMKQEDKSWQPQRQNPPRQSRSAGPSRRRAKKSSTRGSTPS